MRLVNYSKPTSEASYRWLERLGIGAGVFTALIFLLMMGDFIAVRRSDPIHSPALLKLTQEFNSNSQNEVLKEQIRDLDLLARRAFFRSQHFADLAKYLLAIGAVATVVAFKTLRNYQQRLPYPPANPPRDDVSENARWARRVISAVGLVLVGLALSLALPWRSPLDQATKSSMPNPKAQTVAALAASPTFAVSADEFARNWPGFLGFNRGLTTETELPMAWDGQSGQGIVWKTELPKPGRSSPVIWEGRIFLTGADVDVREVYCLNITNGAFLWKHQATEIKGSPAKAPDVTEDATLAASTMATDGKRVFAIFGTGDVVALDFDGRRLWARNLGVPANSYGHGSSLACAGDTLIVQFDQNKNGVLLALNSGSGESRWKVDRTCKASWATPLIMEMGGKRQVVVAADPAVMAYDFDSGTELWRVDCLNRSEVAPSPVYANGLIYVAAEGAGVLAIDPAKRAVVWSGKDSAPGVSTPLVLGDLLFYGLNDGGIACRNSRSGEKLWEAETDDGFYSSPLHSEGRLFLIDRAGVTHIFGATNQFNLLAAPALGEPSAADPAAYGKSLYLRSKKHLFRIGT